jgi:PAS domain S-box-containing protein
MKTIVRYLNPIARLGSSKYSYRFPLFFTILIPIISELYVQYVVHDVNAVGSYIIFVNVAAILYFSFRDGIRGGLIASTGSLLYYLYIIFSRNYSGEQFVIAIEATIVLGFFYYLLATIIGWLKQTIDLLIGKETEARLSAEEGSVRLQTILQQLPVGVLIADTKGNVIGNKQLEKIIGSRVNPKLERDENYVSKVAFKSQKPLVAREWPLVRALHRGEVTTAEEIEYYKTKSKKLFLRVNASPIFNRDKKIIAAVSTIDDVTQEKELEQRKDDFVNMASHELKTPITSMKLYIESLLKRVRSSKYERALKTL